MGERDTADRDWPDELAPDEPSSGAPVSERGPLNADGDAEGGETGAGGDPLKFKRSYAEELKARAHAAEQKEANVRALFKQERAELKRETDALRQRLARSAEERVAREKANFIAALLPVIDNLRRAVEAAEGGGSKESLLDGLRGTLSGFESAVARAGVESIEAGGRPFDPELHEAVDTVEVEPERDGQVTAQYSRGYRLGDQLLRPARVQVGRGRGAAASARESCKNF